MRRWKKYMLLRLGRLIYIYFTVQKDNHILRVVINLIIYNFFPGTKTNMSVLTGANYILGIYFTMKWEANMNNCLNLTNWLSSYILYRLTSFFICVILTVWKTHSFSSTLKCCYVCGLEANDYNDWFRPLSNYLRGLFYLIRNCFQKIILFMKNYRNSKFFIM